MWLGRLPPRGRMAALEDGEELLTNRSQVEQLDLDPVGVRLADELKKRLAVLAAGGWVTCAVPAHIGGEHLREGVQITPCV